MDNHLQQLSDQARASFTAAIEQTLLRFNLKEAESTSGSDNLDQELPA